MKTRVHRTYILLVEPTDPAGVRRKCLWIRPKIKRGTSELTVMLGFYSQGFLLETGSGISPLGTDLTLTHSELLNWKFQPHKVSFHLGSGDVVMQDKSDGPRLGRLTGKREKTFMYEERPSISLLCSFIPREARTYPKIAIKDLAEELKSEGALGVFAHPAITSEEPLVLHIFIAKERKYIPVIKNFPIPPSQKEWFQLKASPNLPCDLWLLVEKGGLSNWPSREIFGYPKKLS